VGSIFSQRVGRLVALSVGFLPIERLLAPPLRLQSVQAPTLGMWSTGERYLTEKAMVASESRVTGGWRYERVENASHWLQLDQPERVNALLLEFLGEPGSEAR